MLHVGLGCLRWSVDTLFLQTEADAALVRRATNVSSSVNSFSFQPVLLESSSPTTTVQDDYSIRA